MTESRSLLRDPKKQIFLAMFMAAVVFILLLGRQGSASHVVVNGDTAYVAVGRYGGVRILNVSNPAAPVEIGFYNTPGDAVRTALSGSYLFVADGARGLRVLEVSDPAMPVVIGSVTPRGSVQDLVISGNYAYLALGEGGMAVVDISNPTRPVVVGGFDTAGFAQRVAVVPGTPYVFLADGAGGMHIVDIRLPISPRVINTYDGPREVRDIAVSGPLAVVAAGRDGVRILNILDPQFPMDYVNVEIGGTVYSIAIQGSFVYAANGDGVSMIDFANVGAPNIVSNFPTPGTARMVTVAEGYIYVADEIQGLRILERANPFDPDRMGLYETPGEASFVQLLGSMGSILTGRWANVTGKIWRTIGLVLFDIVLFFIVLGFWLFIFGQFVMPVRTLTERWQVTSRLISYFFGDRGPAIFIRNGKIIEGAYEKHRRGPGVALLDTASGAVLRNAHSFVRAVGPGVVFTDRSQYFSGVVDLHRQSKSLGPNEGENPFAPQQEDETADAFAERQKRRYQTSALTRDGVEVVAVISVFFKLTAEPGQGNTRFGFNASSVWNAIAREAVNPDAVSDTNRHHVSWDWLPRFLAADLWREYLRKVTLDELFAFAPAAESTPPNQPRLTAFDMILKMMRARLTEAVVEELNENGERTDNKIPSKEYRLLRQRGIQVLGVSVRSVRFPESVEQQLITQWKATWMQRAQREKAEVESRQAHERIEGQTSSQKAFAVGISQPLINRLKHASRRSVGLQHTLDELVQGTLRLIIREPDLQNHLTHQKAGLIELIDWIRKQ